MFDAVEFSDDIATGDVLYDLAFLLMDLEERGLRAAANRLFNRYLAPEPMEALVGLIALPLFLSLRAAIRAKVEAASAERLQGQKRDETRALARRYFDCAVRFLRPVPPRLVAVGGLSGVGKSALGGVLAPEIGRAPGALWLRSDVERKTMFGIEETVRLPASAYASEVTREVYERLIDKARIALQAGQGVLLDATFASAAERSAAAALAAEAGVAFVGLFLDAPLATRLERIGSRRADASDADANVARRQSAEPLGEEGWAAVSASGSLSDTTILARARLGPSDERETRPVPGRSTGAGSMNIKCSCSVQWNRGMRWNELGASLGPEWASEIARAPISEGILMISTSFRVALSAFLFAGALGLASTGPVQAQSIMKQCGDDWKAAKENNTTNGMKWPEFLKQCRVQKEGAAAPAAAPFGSGSRA